MTWHTGNADGYLELLQDLIELATNAHVDSVTVSAGGSGYAVGDILAINGGTVVGGHTAAVEVLTLSGSAVATVRIARGGAYTANPGASATTTAETGGGSGCTITTTIASTGWTLDRRSQEAVSATIGAGGTGYTVGDQLTLVGGVRGIISVDTAAPAAVFEVASTSGGVVTAVTLVSEGNYEEVPSNDVIVSGGTGTGCELTVTWQDATTQDQVVIMHTTAGSFTDPYIAIRTYTTVDAFLGSEPVRNWHIVGLPAYSPGLALHAHPNKSPGIDNGGNLGTYCPCIPLKDTDASYPITFWFGINDRRIVGVFEVTDSTPVFHYPSMYAGLYAQAGSRVEFPYPMLIGQSGWRTKTQYAETTPVITGIVECVGAAAANSLDPGGICSSHIYDTGSAQWIGLLNMDMSDAGTGQNDDQDGFQHHGVYPIIAPYQESTPEPFDVFNNSNNAVQWYDEIIDHQLPAAPRVQLLPTPDGASDKYLLIPATLVGHDLTEANATMLDDIFGELESVYYVAAYPVGDITTRDTFLIGSARYRVFSQGNRTQPNTSYMVIREE